MSKIHFRQVDAPYPVSGAFWHIEYFPEETPLFPVGIAIVCSLAEGRGQLNFIFVADQWRRQGIARKILKACAERWPNLTFTGPMDERGEGLLRDLPSFCEWEDDPIMD